MPALSLLSCPGLVSACRRVGWLIAASWALGVQAAVVQPAVDLLQPDGGMPPPAPSALERALTVDTNTSQRNLDLLLDARRAGDAGVAPLRGSRLPDDRRTLPAAETRTGLVPLGLQAEDSVTAPGATERREWQTAAPAARYGGGPGDPGSGRGDAGQGASSRGGDRSGDRGELADMIANAIAFMREHRFALLGGAGLLALLAASLQAVVRRR